jgi:lipopolysaccharide/colanic/teichoic acid biosynthesis glycosyltransferase
LADIVELILALIVLRPFMSVIAIAVQATSKGPVLFMQQRAGPGGELFTFLKNFVQCMRNFLRSWVGLISNTGGNNRFCLT